MCGGIRVDLLILEQRLKPTIDVFKAFKPLKYFDLDDRRHGYNPGMSNTFIEAKDFMDNMKVKLKYPKEGLNSIQEP